MNVGLPGTGIGGLFYLLSVIFIFTSELIAVCRGKGNRQRWHTVIEQLLMTITMIFMAFITNYYFSKILFKKYPIPLPDRPALTDKVVNLYQNHPLLIPVTLLLAVLIFINALYLFLRARKTR